MKDSGIPWIGEIPEGWEIHLIGRNIKEVQNINTECVESNALQFQMGSIIPKSRGNSKYTPETLASYNIVDRGDIMINGLNLSFDFISQRIGQVKERGVITSAYLAVRPDDTFSSDYLTYLLKSYDNCKALHGMGKGLRQTLLYKEFRRYCVIVPPVAEQEAIAAFLDRKCGEVDEMVSLQEQVIEELKAYKQSVITEAVTKGLNPTAPMKPSNIDWIGQIPTHWDTARIKNVFMLQTGSTPKGYDEEITDEDDVICWFTPSDILDDFSELSSSSRKLKSSIIDKNNIRLNPIGTLIFVGIGSVGKIGYSLVESYSNQQITSMIPTQGFSKYYYFFMVAAKDSIKDKAFFTILPIVNNSYLSKIEIVFPPLSEQREIADYLDRKCADIDALIALKQQKIEDLKQYKKSLIYEYVTGKKQTPNYVFQ